MPNPIPKLLQSLFLPQKPCIGIDTFIPKHELSE